MKIKVDDKEIFELSQIQKQVIQNDIHADIFEEDMKRRLKWVLYDEKYRKCMERLRKEWEPKLKASGVAMIPSNDDVFAQLVFSQPSYRDRKAREISGQA